MSVSSDCKVELMEIGSIMHKSGLPSSFVAAAVEIAFEFEGVYDLIVMWGEETDQKEKDAIVADIQDLIFDCNQKEKIVYLSTKDFDMLENELQNPKGPNEKLKKAFKAHTKKFGK